ncbi:Shikimate dehydrogenase [Penicillium malachiteum]|uniref:Shikimate dehydrogenase n=1 Tax=Penicillium malachiteum TaxID=1324776 RepID=UPI002546EE85|nr:Shikimate dehydrogenase [Penicillium malachiteum]KAJ5724984.1 Shikimate dehydrogenase [Penicillium malachiteum]
MDSNSTAQNEMATHQSIFVIGMRGTGKTTMGKWLAELLSWTFVDLDEMIGEQNGLKSAELIRRFGWDKFRPLEIAALKETMRTKARSHVISCGGGIVETEEARTLLKEWHATGTVLLVHRDMQQVVEYLRADKTRHEFPQDIQEIYERRKPWFEECSNLSYLSPRSHHGDGIPQHFEHFVRGIKRRALEEGRAISSEQSESSPSSQPPTPPIDCLTVEI